MKCGQRTQEPHSVRRINVDRVPLRRHVLGQILRPRAGHPCEFCWAVPIPSYVSESPLLMNVLSTVSR